MYESQQEPQERKVSSGNIFLMVCQALAVSVEVFLHRTDSFGQRYFRLQSALAILLIFFYPIFWEGHDVRPVIVFDAAYILMVFYIQMRTAARVRRGGPQPHTLYTGTPLLMRLARRTEEVRVKELYEPMLVFLTGALVTGFNDALGGYLMIASVGLLFSVGQSVAQQRQRSLDMHDTYIEQQNVFEQFRDTHRD